MGGMATHIAGVTQREFDRKTGVGTLIHERILPALRRPRVHRRFENIMVSLTGGPRAFDRAGIRLRTNDAALRAFLAGNEPTGKLEVPLLSLHTTATVRCPSSRHAF